LGTGALTDQSGNSTLIDCSGNGSTHYLEWEWEQSLTGVGTRLDTEKIGDKWEQKHS